MTMRHRLTSQLGNSCKKMWYIHYRFWEEALNPSTVVVCFRSYGVHTIKDWFNTVLDITIRHNIRIMMVTPQNIALAEDQQW